MSAPSDGPLTPPKIHATKQIFSPRPDTPATPPSFPFLSTPSPELKRSKTTVSPPTPPRRPRARQTSSADNVFIVTRRTSRTSFETALAAFPTPPARSHFSSRPTSPDGHDQVPLLYESEGGVNSENQDGDSEDMMMDLMDDDSDGRTVTGIPATPSTASSGRDTFWSEVSVNIP